jgi:tetratricopeptide (TPR) repeat protein
MLGDELSKSDVETQIAGKGEFVQIDMLNTLLHQKLHRDTKKFIYMKLIDIYDKRHMYNDAAKMYEGLASICIAFSEQIKNYLKATEYYIRAGFFDKADYSMRKALNEANSVERNEINFTVKDFYKKLAEDYEIELKRNSAARIYEKLLEMGITDEERKEIKEKLMELYEKLGKLKEFYAMKKMEEREFSKV